MKNARAKRANLLLFTIKYANLLRSCCRRRRGCVSSLISQAVTTRVLPSVSIMSARCGVVVKSGCAMDAKRCVSQRKIMKTGKKKNVTEH